MGHGSVEHILSASDSGRPHAAQNAAFASSRVWATPPFGACEGPPFQSGSTAIVRGSCSAIEGCGRRSAVVPDFQNSSRCDAGFASQVLRRNDQSIDALTPPSSSSRARALDSAEASSPGRQSGPAPSPGVPLATNYESAVPALRLVPIEFHCRHGPSVKRFEPFTGLSTASR
jgi:hypothetical protein